MNVADTAYPLFLDKLSACRDFLHGLDYRNQIRTDSAEQMAEAIADGADFLLDPEREKDRKDFIKCAKEMAQAFGLCRSMVADDLKIEEAYIDVLRTQLLKVLNANPGNP